MSKRTIIKQVRHPMDWVQTFAIIGSMIGVWFAFFTILREDMKLMREDMKSMEYHWETQHKEDQERWKWLFERTDNKLDQLRGKQMALKEKLLIFATIGIFIGNGLLYFCLCHLREINERDKRIERAVLED